MDYLRSDYFTVPCEEEMEIPENHIFSSSSYDENLGIMKVFVDQDTLNYLRFKNHKQVKSEFDERYNEYWSSRF